MVRITRRREALRANATSYTKVSLAAKEMRESLYWLGLVMRTESESDAEIPKLLQEGGELVAILMSSAKTAKG